MGGIDMKPFSLREHIKNPLKKVVTRDGREVRIICTDFNNNTYPIIIEVKDMLDPVAVTREGRFFCSTMPNDLDLFFAPEKHEGWVNMYRDTVGKMYFGNVYSSKEEAKKSATSLDTYVTTAKVEWEEE